MITRQDRLNALERQVERLERRGQRLSEKSKQYWSIQLWIFLGGVSLVIAALFITRWLSLLIIPFGIAAFLYIGYLHGKIGKGHFKNSILLSSKKIQVARMRLDWDALPQPLDSEEVDHPFEVDLDLLGERSLHRLMNTAVSFEGGQLLSDWLLHPPADRGAILRRQSFVQELLPLVGFRNKLLFNSLLATRYTQS